MRPRRPPWNYRGGPRSGHRIPPRAAFLAQCVELVTKDERLASADRGAVPRSTAERPRRSCARAFRRDTSATLLFLIRPALVRLLTARTFNA